MSGIDQSDKGLGAAVKSAHVPDAPVPNVMDGEQMSLMPLRNASEGREAAKRLGTSGAGRGRGRPPGAKNKSTKAWTDYILARYTSPLVMLAEIATRPLPDLAAELMEYAGSVEGAKPTYAQVMEILKLQVAAAKELAPFIHQKQPTAIQGAENGLINLMIGDVNVAQVGVEDATDLELEIIDVESVENQGLSNSNCEKSNVSESNVLPRSVGECDIESKGATD